MSLPKPTPEMEALLARPLIAAIATAGPRGPHVAPVWFEYDGGIITVLTGRGSQKERNVRRDARVGFTVFHGNRAVIVNGAATVEALPDDTTLERLAVHYLGEEGARAYRATRTAEAESVALRITPAHWMAYGL
jgi:PPOX class probable F420-dependent enzyme